MLDSEKQKATARSIPAQHSCVTRRAWYVRNVYCGIATGVVRS